MSFSSCGLQGACDQGGLITADPDFHHLMEVLLVHFLHRKAALFFFFQSLPYFALWQDHTMLGPRLKNGAWASPSPRAEYLHTLRGTCIHRIFVSSPIDWLTHYFYVSVDWWLALLPFRSQPNTTVFGDSNCSSFGPGSSFGWHLCPFDTLLSIKGFCLFLSTSLLSSSASCFRLILHISCSGPRISHFSEEPHLLLLENGFRNEDLGARCRACILFNFSFENNFKL